MTAITRYKALGAVLLALSAVSSGSSWAQTKSASSQNPSGDRIIEQQLLEDLKTAPKAPQDSAAGGGGEPAQSLKQVLENMRAAERLLAEQDVSRATQERQRQIVDGIARLLDQVGESPRGSPKAKNSGEEREAPGRPGEGDPKPGTSSGAPNNQRSASGAGVLPQHDINRWLSQMWGHLPPRVRNQLQAPRSEHFLPKYERTIEEYYLRLAEEREAVP